MPRQAGMVINKGLNGLIEYSEPDTSIVAGVEKSTKHKKKTSK